MTPLRPKVHASDRMADPIVIQPPPIIVQQAPIVINDGNLTPSTQSAPVTDLRASPQVQECFREELQPELERLRATGMSRIQSAFAIVTVVNEAFERKDALYNILVRYQPSYENDTAYVEGLRTLIENWALQVGA